MKKVLSAILCILMVFCALPFAAADADTAGKAPERAEALALALADAKNVYESLIQNFRTAAAQSSQDKASRPIPPPIRIMTATRIATVAVRI